MPTYTITTTVQQDIALEFLSKRAGQAKALFLQNYIAADLTEKYNANNLDLYVQIRGALMDHPENWVTIANILNP
jgi:hypothetical protein